MTGASHRLLGFDHRPSRGVAVVVVVAIAVVAIALVAVQAAAGASPMRYPRSVTLTNAKVARWAAVVRPAVARKRPSVSAPAVTKLDTVTFEATQNIVLILSRLDVSKTVTWYRVRLPILPNNSTGWVRATDLGTVTTVRTHLYVDRKNLTATLKRNGVTIFKTIIGVGKSYWPTPAGQFYIRNMLTDFGNPFYGPVAFGTSARSPTLTDWPGGGYVGIHGTNTPEILPGYVSHGCVRLPNDAILRLSKLMPVGTPLTVT